MANVTFMGKCYIFGGECYIFGYIFAVGQFLTSWLCDQKRVPQIKM